MLGVNELHACMWFFFLFAIAMIGQAYASILTLESLDVAESGAALEAAAG